jgi:O-methyltransferase
VGIADMSPEELYLDLLKKCLTRTAFPEHYRPLVPAKKRRLRRALVGALRRRLQRSKLDLVRVVEFDPERRLGGIDQPPEAETMIGMRRLDNLQHCITDVLRQGVPGDLVETGVWRGGAVIFMRAVLEAYGDTSRTVWAADSFAGLPRPDEDRYPADRGDRHWTREQLAISVETVKENFARYGLLDDRVRFLIGWFADTLPTAPIERLSILRLDGDMYGSTMDALRPLYPKLSKGGYCIVDDYSLPGCREAVEDYRREHGISEEILRIDESGSYWQKQA